MQVRRNFLVTLGLGPVAMASGQTSSGREAVPDQQSGASAVNLDIFQASYKGDIPRVKELAKLNPAIHVFLLVAILKR